MAELVVKSATGQLLLVTLAAHSPEALPQQVNGQSLRNPGGRLWLNVCLMSQPGRGMLWERS